jgi:O-antigen/teichoic acid export membrane protein
LVVLRTLIQLYCQVELSILKSLDRMATIGRIQAVHFVVLLAGIGAVYQLRAPVAWLLLVLVGGQLLEFVLSGGVLARAGARLHRVPMRECLGLVKRSTPIGFTHALANIILRLDVLVLSVLASPIEVGQFAVAHALLVMVYVAAWLFGSVLLPQMVRLAESAAESAALVERWTRVVLLVTLPLAALAWWLVPPVLATVFGARFAASGGLAAWLLLASPLVLLNSLHVNHAMARGWTATYLGAHVATAVFALSLNLALGLQFGGPGIAAAVLLRELFLFAVLKWKGARMAVQAAQLAPCTESHD